MGGRVGVVDAADRQFDVQRFGERGVIARQVVARDRAANADKIRRDLPPDVAAIEIIEARVGQVRQRCGERFLLQDGPGRRRLAIHQESRGKAWRRRKLGKLVLGQLCLAA